MSIKKFLASAAALAICSATMILPVSAEEAITPQTCGIEMVVNSVTTGDGTALAYSSSGNAAYNTDNNGTSFRLNLYNTWGNNVTDLDNQSVVEGNITVNVTISGLNGHTTNVDDMGNPTDAYSMYLAGSVGANQFWGIGDSANNVDNAIVPITGDGTYDVVFMLNEGSESIDCLFLQSNINIYQLGDSEPEDTTPEETTTPEATEGDTTTTSGDTTTTAGDTTTAEETTTTAKGNSGNTSGNKNNSSSNNSSNKTNSSSNNSSNKTNNDTPVEAESLPTGDTGVVGIAFAGLIAAGCATLVIKKK